MGLVAENLNKRYRGKPVVLDVSIELEPGEVVGLLGPNGAGKTTSFYMMVGLERPESGRISLDGRDITRMPMYKRARMGLGYLAQEASVFRKLTVEENVLAILEIMGFTRMERRTRLAVLLEEFGLEPVRRQYGFTLSGGERRRTEIARALAADPSFILLDEPFTGVDPIAVADIQEIIARLRAKGLGVLITDQNVRETLAITDRAYIMHQGRILVSGPSGSIAENEMARRVYLGERFRM
ncbi:MAG: LPS export ABC transporter ATP-binding protein [Firmicutes bacterium]|nr:LPS export ABC transporter ATP-binding protein [Bacillota bacterium]